MGAEQSQLNEALSWFDLERIDGITLDDLKRRFKKALSAHHPDRGGKEGDFEKIIEAYEYLSAVIKRSMGGRAEKGVIDVGDIIKQRDRDFVMEMNNMISDVFDEIDRRDIDDFFRTFNGAFVKHSQPLFEDGGYSEWLTESNLPAKENKGQVQSFDERFAEWMEKRERSLQQAIHDIGDSKEESSAAVFDELNHRFEKDTRATKDPVSETVILHPMEMAIVDGRCYGTEIIRRENRYHSSMYVNPEYVDLYEAYTSQNIQFDKLPEYEEAPLPSMEEILKEREKSIEQVDVEDGIKFVHEYERRYFEEEQKKMEEVKTYFNTTNATAWALKDTSQPALHTIYRDTKPMDEKKDE
jgi:hypothetical protein